VVTIGQVENEVVIENETGEARPGEQAPDEVQREELREIVRALVREELERSRRLRADV